MTEEMIKLRSILDDEGIEWWDKSEPETSSLLMYRTKFHCYGYDWSVIHGYGSYGGYTSQEEDEGLLELMSRAVNGGEPVGWLTAEKVMEYVRRAKLTTQTKMQETGYD